MSEQYSISFAAFQNWLTLLFGWVESNNDGDRLTAGALFYSILSDCEADMNEALLKWERLVCPLPRTISFTHASHNDSMYHSWDEWLDSVRVTIGS